MRNFNYIIGLMLLAMIALIGFQWYWIENAIAVKRDQFDKKVIESMNQAVTKIEKQEVLFLANQKIKEQEIQTLAALTEKKKRYRKVLKKRPLPSAAERPSERTLATNTTPKRLEPKRVEIKTEIEEAPDSIYLVFQPSQPFPIWDDYSFNIQISDQTLNERNIIPEKRMAFIKRMMQEQNNVWQAFDQKANELLNRNRTVDQILNLIDQEFQSFIEINTRPRLSSGQGSPAVASSQPQVRAIEIREGNNKQVNGSGNSANNKLVLDSVNAKKPDEIEKNTKVSLAKNKVGQVNKKKESIEPEYEWVEVEEELSGLEKSRNKANLVKDVLSDFMHGKRDIYERLNQEMLDTLLRKELTNKGIDIDYEFGVKNNGNMMFASYGLDQNPTLSDLSYSVRLFPNDALEQQQYLFVYFPQKENFIMGNMWTVFGSSIFLILMIGGIFYSSINTMLKQKKLSTIKNDFINNMTHEFKTPISTISLAVEVMKDNGSKRSPEKYLNIIKDENSRLGSQVEKVLQMALLDKGGVKLNQTRIDIHETIEQVCQNLSVQIEQKEGVLELNLEAENKDIFADEVHLTNIIYNLIDNANKYSPEKPQIKVTTRDVHDGIIVSVIDKGIGMRKDQLNKIFDKFYRAAKGNVHDVKGFGLGLSYVKKMMDLHNGNIRVRSKLGEGSVFELEFQSNELLNQSSLNEYYG